MHIPGRARGRWLAAGAAALLGLAVSCSGSSPKPAPSASGAATKAAGGTEGSYVIPAGIHQIQHVIVVQQENRSFDSYFGTYPGADGIAMRDGKPTVCVPAPAPKGCD